jgi:PPOX class probable F420-dependent enzyme
MSLMATMNPDARDEFLATTRYGYLTTLAPDGSPRTVPVWFDWDGQAIRIFTGIDTPKVKRIRRDPRATLLVSNDLSEKEAWVSFDGIAQIRFEGGIELAERLAAKYWDLSDPGQKATLDSWKDSSEELCVIELSPQRIRTYVD